MHAKDIVGKTVVLTGKFATLKRAEAEAALTRLGATVGGSITKATNILFAGEKAGSKLEKAEAMGILISDEATLEALLAGVSTAVEGAAKKAKPAGKKEAAAKPAGKKEAAAKPAKKEAAAKPAAQKAAAAKPAAKSGAITSFDGKVVALTGTLTTMKRAEAESRLTDAGATVGGMTKATEILIYGEKAGSKLAKAEAQGTALMTEAEMLTLLGDE